MSETGGRVPVRSTSPPGAQKGLRTEGVSGQTSEIDPRDVQDRSQLNEYLSQSLWGEYRERKQNGRISQASTFLKTYLVEGHASGDRPSLEQWQQVFSSANSRRDDSLVLLVDRRDVAYFADLADSRFILLHTIGRSESTDETVDTLTQSTDGFDRAWLPTDFLYGSRRGKLRGFKFGHLTAVSGITGYEEEAAELEVDGFDPGEVLPLPDMQAVSEAPLSLPTALSGGPPRSNASSRLTVTNTLTAEADYQLIRNIQVFAGRQALDNIQFTSRAEDGLRLSCSIYATGKLVGNGTSLGAHLTTAHTVRANYGRAIREIESELAIGWVQTANGIVHRGEPLLFSFPTGMVLDLPDFVGSLFRATKPFRLFGIPHTVTERRIDVEAIDLHTGDPLAFEITHEWMRVYLPRKSCGNIIARLYTNLQRTTDSRVGLAAGGGDILFTELTARYE